MSAEKRQTERYAKKMELNFSYDAAAKLVYRVESSNPTFQKFAGVSKNICANGLCLTTHHPLKKGQRLHLEVYLPKDRHPIHMDGEVRWCDPVAGKKNKDLFDAGIKLESVEGESVDDTVHVDQTHHVVWSNVLESVFGTFRKLAQERAKA